MTEHENKIEAELARLRAEIGKEELAKTPAEALPASRLDRDMIKQAVDGLIPEEGNTSLAELQLWKGVDVILNTKATRGYDEGYTISFRLNDTRAARQLSLLLTGRELPGWVNSGDTALSMEYSDRKRPLTKQEIVENPGQPVLVDSFVLTKTKTKSGNPVDSSYYSEDVTTEEAEALLGVLEMVQAELSERGRLKKAAQKFRNFRK